MSIGEPVARLDGPAKVTGAARYAADQYADGQLYRPRAQALLHIMLIFRLQPRGFTNADLRALLADYLGRPPGTITPGQATYDLRRLKEHGFIRRIPHSHRHHVTDIGLAQAMFLARAHDRLLLTGLAELTSPATSSPIRQATRAYQAALDDLTARAGPHIAA